MHRGVLRNGTLAAARPITHEAFEFWNEQQQQQHLEGVTEAVLSRDNSTQDGYPSYPGALPLSTGPPPRLHGSTLVCPRFCVAGLGSGSGCRAEVQCS